jgi:polysaccharide export outer membrane protein
MLKRIIGLVLTLGILGTAGSAEAQEEELKNLVEESQQQQDDLEQIPGGDLPGLGQDLVSGKVRLPSGEDVEKLRISQDREIDPDTYVVGPGDVIQLYIWGEFDLSYMLQIDPEGYIIIPTVGAFDVSGLTLTEAKGYIHDAARGKYPGVDVTINLASMRFFTAYATGAVLKEGSFTIHPATRVSDLIELAGGYTDELRGTTFQDEVGGAKVTRVRQIVNQATARRSIQLIHQDHTVEMVDLGMFLATGDVKYNPYVRMGDVVKVTFRDKTMFVFGAVNLPGRHEFREGDTIENLVNLAQGLRQDAPLVRAELWRFKSGTEETEVIELGSNEEGKPGFTYEDIRHVELQSNDMIFIRARSLWQQMPTSLVYGEVKYRGRYRIIPGVTRLKDVVAMAGGLSEDASLIGAKVVRTKMRSKVDPELERLRSLRRVTGLAGLDGEDKAYLKTKAREQKGRASVDFERLFIDNDEKQNIFLESGDVIYIPTKRRTVSVSGQMQEPGLIDYEPGISVRHYMEKAGGYTYEADKSGARLIRARTGAREELDLKSIVGPGDEIWVPQRERVNYWAFFQSTMRTVAETLTLVVLVRSF